MAAWIIRPAFLALVAVVLVLVACTGESGTAPCTPLEGQTGDPCEGDLTQIFRTERPLTFRSVTTLVPSEPYPIRFYLDGGDTTMKEGHLVVRGQYLPGTVRCANRNIERLQPYYAIHTYEYEGGLGFVRCYADLHIADYIVGSGPSTLTVLAEWALYWDTTLTAPQAKAARRSTERVLVDGGSASRLRGVPSGGITGVETILFLGPAYDASMQAWQTFTKWDVERRADGTVIAVHPDRSRWQDKDDYEKEYRSQVEMTLPAFKEAAQAAHTSRLADYGGRIDEEEGLPQLVTDANNLRAFHVETGNINHPDGPPETSLPPACGFAVQGQTSNFDLMEDCMALLEARDMLRGTGVLNWSVDTAIGSWDGVTVERTPQRVTKLELANKGLTGCIPPALREVVVNDLDALGLPDCAE